MKNTNINWNKVIKTLIIVIIAGLAIFLIGTILWNKHVEKYSMTIDEQGLEILNAYEFPSYLIDYEEYCMAPYDIGDGVITFGPGITYPTEQAGIDDINDRYNTSYSLKDDCIDVDLLHELQYDIMEDYEWYANKVAIWHFKHFTQDQFNALVFMSYNSPGLLSDDGFIEVITSDNPTYDDYVIAANNYYKQIPSYYDNPNTEEEDDGFGNGWYNRIVDSAEVFFGIDYEYQNNAI